MKAAEIIQAKGFRDAKGDFKVLDAAISVEEAYFLRDLVTANRPVKSLEIGLANGISALAICESLGTGALHTVIDPLQSTYWEGSGTHVLRSAGLDNFNLIEEPSEFALPRLCREGARFDFAFVDGNHTFDHALVDFFYIDRMLEVGGIVAFDDTDMPSLNRLMRYISRYPNYECIGSRGDRPTSNRFGQLVNAALWTLTLPIGSRLRSRFLNDSVARPDIRLGIDHSLTAFRKKADYDRNWDWHESF